MFAKTIVDSDAFLDMPQSSQNLYFHLSMRADDDGFVNNPKKIQRMTGCHDDDMRILITKKFIIPFESGVVVIKHWRIHNYIRNDRYKPTLYQDEKKQLNFDENNAYTLNEVVGIPSDNQMDTQVRLGKDSLGKGSIEEDILPDDTHTPSPKTEDSLLEEEFEKLWKLYPKKVGKPKALAKYKKYRTSKKEDYCTYGDVFGGLEKYLKYIEENTWYSPKDGSTWFNQQGWLDEYELKEETKYESEFTLHNVDDYEDEPIVNEDALGDFEELLNQFRSGGF